MLSPPFWISILWGPLSENFGAPHQRVHAVISLAAGQATAAQLAALVRGHWKIEAVHPSATPPQG
ncbi:hypothetical protein [Streptomyces noursei]|uniref:hypothetical protein n=1 Tax=Streptomyces noursei TaxID=1971 RepID=UPI00340C685D